MLRALTEAREQCLGEGDPLLEALDKLNRVAPTGGILFIIADLNRDPSVLEAPLGRLRQRHEVVLLPVQDPADWAIPDLGWMVFGDATGQRIEVNTANSEGRRRYHEAWQRNRSALENLAVRLGLFLIPVATDQEIHQVLAAGLRRRARHPGGRR